MKRKVRKTSGGFSLLELMVTIAMMATLATTITLILRGAQSAWEAHDSDHARLQAAHATLRHLTRQLRQAEGVIAISSPADLSGTISALMPNGDTVVWDHAVERVSYGVTTADHLLAEPIKELSFTAYRADGATTTTSGPEIHSVLCTVKVELPQQASSQRTISSWVWMRAW